MKSIMMAAQSLACGSQVWANFFCETVCLPRGCLQIALYPYLSWASFLPFSKDIPDHALMKETFLSFLSFFLSFSLLSVHNILSHTRFMNGIMENGKAIMSVSKFLSQKHRIFFFRIWKGNVV